MTTVLDHEHAILAKLLQGAALVAHGEGCEMCSRLDVRRTIDGLAAQIRAAKVNDTPHKHGQDPKPQPKPQPKGPPPKQDPRPDDGGKK